MFLLPCKLKLKKIKWRSCAAALWIQVKCGAGVTFQSSGRVSKSLRSFFEWRRMFAAASYVVSDHLEVQRNFCAERVRQVVGGKPITHRAMIGPIERRRADELLSLQRRLHTPPGPGLAPKVRGPVSKTLGSVLAGGVVGAHTARTAQSCVELLRLSRRTHPRLEAHRSADPGGGRQLTTVQAKETDRKIFFARKSATLELRRRVSVGY